MNILKIYPHIYSIDQNQKVSVVLASMPCVHKSSHNFQVISAHTNHKLEDEKIIYLSEEQCFLNADKLKNNDLSLYGFNPKVNYLLYLTSIKQLITEMNPKPQLIEVEFDLNLAYDIAKEFHNIPVSLVNHIDLIKSSPVKNIKTFLKLWHISGLIFVSHFFHKHFLKYFFFLKSKAYVVHNSYGHVSELDYNTEKKNQIIFLGRANYRKGIKEYIQAISAFLADNQNWQGLIIGSFEKKREEEYFATLIENPQIQALITKGQLHIKTNIPNKDALKALMNAKIAVFPTIAKHHKEGIPLVALEAALAKCLIISSTSGGYPEINPFEETLLNRVSKNSILEKLITYTSNPAKMQEQQNKQYNFIKENFSLEKQTLEFDNIRSEIVDNFHHKMQKKKK